MEDTFHKTSEFLKRAEFGEDDLGPELGAAGGHVDAVAGVKGIAGGLFGDLVDGGKDVAKDAGVLLKDFASPALHVAAVLEL